VVEHSVLTGYDAASIDNRIADAPGTYPDFKVKIPGSIETSRYDYPLKKRHIQEGNPQPP
jgi:hypothetical protein